MRKNDNRKSEPTFTACHLQKAYTGILQRRMGELHHFLHSDDQRSLSMTELESLHLRVHNLMGSGAIYGHGAVSEAALRMDNMLNASITPPESKELADVVGKLLKACEDALAEAKPLPCVDTSRILKLAAAETRSSRPILLTVDDDPAIHDLVEALFGDDVEILSAYNSDEAIKATRGHRLDLILMDNYMPGMNGFALLERLRSDENAAQIPVIMLTAEKQPHAKARAAMSGIVDYITKPFDPTVFAERIFGFLNRFRMTVLVASENAAERQQLSKKLRQQGLEVIEATDSTEAFVLASNCVPELIVLDECMQDANGSALLHDLNKTPATRSIPVLYLTVNRRGGKIPEDCRTTIINHPVTPFVPAEIVAHTLEILGINSDPSV